MLSVVTGVVLNRAPSLTDIALFVAGKRVSCGEPISRQCRNMALGLSVSDALFAKESRRYRQYRRQNAALLIAGIAA